MPWSFSRAMFVILPISVESKEQTWLHFVAPSFSQWHPYTRTMSGLFSNSVDGQVNCHSLLESSKEQVFNSPGDISRWGVQQTCCVETAWDRRSGTLLQGRSRGTALISLFTHSAQGMAGKFWLHCLPVWTLVCPQTSSKPPSPAPWKQKGIGLTLTSFCSLCRHSSSVSSISLSAKTHTHKGQTQRKAIYIPGMFISMKHWRELVSAALPIAPCISVWEAPKAEMTLMGCSVISLLPNNLN